MSRYTPFQPYFNYHRILDVSIEEKGEREKFSDQNS
jgi:hypothetical protein